MNESDTYVNSLENGARAYLMRATIYLLLIALISGCVSIEYPYTPEEEARFKRLVLGESREVPATAMLTLNDEIEAALDEHISDRWSDRHKLNALRAYLFDEDQLNVSYNADNTKTAAEMWESREGNCLSMTSLFIAAARHVGLDASFKTVAVRPTWDHYGSTMIRYEHIIAVGQLSTGQEYVVDFLPEFVIGDRRAYKIEDEYAKALYYNNLGAEDVIRGDYESAIENLKYALRMYPNFSDAWNNMGAALRRHGDHDLAEFAYQQALKLDVNNYSALSNLAQFYKADGREREAEHFLDRVNRYRRRNPYFHYFIARFFFDKGEYEEAIMLLERSIQLKRDEPDFYEAMARTYDRIGNEQMSGTYMALADKYREENLEPAPRVHNHRFWIQTINVN